MSNHLFYYFETENGKILARAKQCGEKVLPLSCYYDHADVIPPVRQKLMVDVFPILRFIEKEICHQFDIRISGILYTAWMNFAPAHNYSTLNDLEKLANKFLIEHDLENLNYISILIA